MNNNAAIWWRTAAAAAGISDVNCAASEGDKTRMTNMENEWPEGADTLILQATIYQNADSHTKTLS